MKNVYITRIAKFLPNEPVDNESMEQRLGLVDGKTSKARRLILRNNKIKTRYYALDSEGLVTHNNAQLTQEAIERLCDSSFSSKEIEVLSCGTSSPDHIVPNHAAMVHGELGNGNLEINSAAGACCSGMNALKFGFLSVKSGQSNNAVCTGSERPSTWLKSHIFEDEVSQLKEVEENPILAFNKEFLRWMLSDGAGAVLLENKPNGNTPLKIEWMEGYSYAFELETCMYAGGDKLEDGSIKPWTEYPSDEWSKISLFAIKQDVKILDAHILKKGVASMKLAMEKHNITEDDIDYYLPHISSYYFKEKLYEEIERQGMHIGWDKWFMNLERVGNVGAASIYLMLEELVSSGKLNRGDRIFLQVPESARFTYAYAYLTVC